MLTLKERANQYSRELRKVRAELSDAKYYIKACKVLCEIYKHGIEITMSDEPADHLHTVLYGPKPKLTQDIIRQVGSNIHHIMLIIHPEKIRGQCPLCIEYHCLLKERREQRFGVIC